MNLIESFMSMPFDNLRWAVYDYRSRKKLTHDYGALKGIQDMDNFVVVTMRTACTSAGEKYCKVIVAPHDQAPIDAY